MKRYGFNLTEVMDFSSERGYNEGHVLGKMKHLPKFRRYDEIVVL